MLAHVVGVDTGREVGVVPWEDTSAFHEEASCQAWAFASVAGRNRTSCPVVVLVAVLPSDQWLVVPGEVVPLRRLEALPCM